MDNPTLEVLKWGRLNSFLITHIKIFMYNSEKLSLEIIVICDLFCQFNKYSLWGF